MNDVIVRDIFVTCILIALLFFSVEFDNSLITIHSKNNLTFAGKKKETTEQIKWRRTVHCACLDHNTPRVTWHGPYLPLQANSALMTPPPWNSPPVFIDTQTTMARILNVGQKRIEEWTHIYNIYSFYLLEYMMIGRWKGEGGAALSSFIRMRIKKEQTLYSRSLLRYRRLGNTKRPDGGFYNKCGLISEL
jgi:hypothetical protein